MCAVIGTFESENLLPARECPRQPQAIHRRFGARSAKTNLFTGWAGLPYFFCQGQRLLGHVGKIGPPRDLLRDRRHDGRMGVPHQSGTPTHGEIEVPPAVDVPEFTAFTIADDHG